MPRSRRFRLILATLAGLGIPMTGAVAAEEPSEIQSAHARENARLEALFAASDEASLQRNPLDALFRGDMRFADRFGDYVTEDWYDAELAAAQADLSAAPSSSAVSHPRRARISATSCASPLPMQRR